MIEVTGYQSRQTSKEDLLWFSLDSVHYVSKKRVDPDLNNFKTS